MSPSLFVLANSTPTTNVHSAGKSSGSRKLQIPRPATGGGLERPTLHKPYRPQGLALIIGSPVFGIINKAHEELRNHGIWKTITNCPQLPELGQLLTSLASFLADSSCSPSFALRGTLAQGAKEGHLGRRARQARWKLLSAGQSDALCCA